MKAATKTLKNLVFAALPIRHRFQRIYRLNHWKSPESRSGSGSTLESTENIREWLPRMLERHGVHDVTDVGCGDFNWMRHVLADAPTVSTYRGLDIVPDVIAENRRRHGTASVRFDVHDVVRTPFAAADLVILRDCLLHLSNRDAHRALRNVGASGGQLLIASTWVEVEENRDIVSGRWRFVNLERPPFELPAPIEIVRENEPTGKSLALWPIADLPR